MIGMINELGFLTRRVVYSWSSLTTMYGNRYYGYWKGIHIISGEGKYIRSLAEMNSIHIISYDNNILYHFYKNTFLGGGEV